MKKYEKSNPPELVKITNKEMINFKVNDNPTLILEKLKERFKESKQVKKCPTCSDVIKNDNIEICEKCGSELIKERKGNFENFIINLIVNMQKKIEKHQAYIKKLEKQAKIKTKIISQMTERQWTDDQDSLGRTRVPRAPRKGNWGYGS